MHRLNFTSTDIIKKLPNKYVATLVIASRAKQIKENPETVDNDKRGEKPTFIALSEFLEDKLKYPEYNITKINDED